MIYFMINKTGKLFSETLLLIFLIGLNIHIFMLINGSIKFNIIQLFIYFILIYSETKNIIHPNFITLSIEAFVTIRLISFSFMAFEAMNKSRLNNGFDNYHDSNSFPTEALGKFQSELMNSLLNHEIDNFLSYLMVVFSIILFYIFRYYFSRKEAL